MQNQSEFICTPVSSFFQWNREKQRVCFFGEDKPKSHVYLLVFAAYQHRYLDVLKEEPSINVLYISPLALNSHHYNRREQQQIVVFEFKE